MNGIKVGFACICKSLGDSGKFRKVTVKKASSLSEVEKFELIKQKTRENFDTLYSVVQWCIAHNIELYRVSSDLVPLATHEISNYKFMDDPTIQFLSKKIKEMANKHSIRLSVHPDPKTISFTNWSDSTQFGKSLNQLEYHYDLCQLLGIKDVIIHAGAAQKGLCKKDKISLEEGKRKAKQIAINNLLKINRGILDLLLIENDEYSFNIQDVIEICTATKTKPCLDLHHWKFQPVDIQVNKILKLWGDRKPKCHISSSADPDKLVRKHADNVTVEDWQKFLDVTQGKFDCCFEAKNKELSLLNLKLIEI